MATGMNEQEPKFEVIAEAQVRILLTPERIAAIREGIEALYACEDEYGQDLKKEIAILEEMLVGT